MNNGMVCVTLTEVARNLCNGNCTNCVRLEVGLQRLNEMDGD